VSTIFPLTRLETLRRMESWHFWLVSRRELVSSLLRRELRSGDTLLDVGCGTGANLGLAGDGVRRLGVDIHIEELTPGLLQGDATALPLRPASVDVILALDVLEHVDDDAMVAEAARVLRDGGRLIVTVPALQSLWSVRDQAAGHRRRYSRSMMQALMARHGFRLRDLRGFQFLLLPLLLLTRLRRTSVAARDFEDAPPRWLNRLLLAVNRFELQLPRFLRPSLGSSLALVAVKER
jgi:SAM-dependent methyltransferase